MLRVEVAVGVVLDSDHAKVLVARRPAQAHQGGLWEFPGGKREPGEAIETALARELREELAIEVTQCEPLLLIEHDYVDKHVALNVWLVKQFSGVPQACEGQPLRWVTMPDLRKLEFPAANGPIVQALERILG
jgi:8-oxo-dGTP diphosphatase